MARIWHGGAETGHVHAEGLTLTSGTVTIDTGTFRSGARSVKFDSTASNVAAGTRHVFTGATATRYWFQAYLFFPAASGMPSAATTQLMEWRAGAAAVLTARVKSTG